MFCSECGQELPATATQCTRCSATVTPRAAPRIPETLDDAVAEARRAAREVAAAAQRLSRAAAQKAEAASRDPSGTARAAVKKVAAELDAAGQAIEETLKGL